MGSIFWAAGKQEKEKRLSWLEESTLCARLVPDSVFFPKENGFHTVTQPHVALPGPGALLILSWQSWCFHTKRLEQMENGQTFAQFGCEKILSLNSFSLLHILLAR